jgi:hypothetical protein
MKENPNQEFVTIGPEFGVMPMNGVEYRILFPLKREGARDSKAAVRCRERLGGLLKYYEREAA